MKHKSQQNVTLRVVCHLFPAKNHLTPMDPREEEDMLSRLELSLQSHQRIIDMHTQLIHQGNNSSNNGAFFMPEDMFHSTQNQTDLFVKAGRTLQETMTQWDGLFDQIQDLGTNLRLERLPMQKDRTSDSPSSSSDAPSL